jgi:signal transduction histidine kinase
MRTPLAQDESEHGLWTQLFITTRLLAAVAAVVLLSAHRVTEHDVELIVAAVVWTTVTCLAVVRWDGLHRRPAAWIVDTAVVLGLILLSEDWRSPFYIYGLTTLVLPVTELRPRPAVAWGIGYVIAYFGIAAITALPAARTLRETARLETLATHLLLPIVVTLALGYAAGILRRLNEERGRREQLAVDAERQRIAWELHDSAKQRLHAASLVLSTLTPAPPQVEHARRELDAAVADMQSAIDELRTPLDGRPLDEALRERAAELAEITGTTITVRGGAPPLPVTTRAHVHRIAAEALTNAVRHASATHIDVNITRRDSSLLVRVCDDGTGMPDEPRPGASGLRGMAGRAATIGADLDIGPGDDGRGTAVILTLPLQTNGDTP